MKVYSILCTSTSFQDTQGLHQDLLAKQPYEINYLRGPLNEVEMLANIEGYDALLCGDDALTEKVIEKGKKNRLKFISKYGVGLDKIDLVAANKFEIPVTNCPGVNQISVAEHFFGLLFSYLRNIHLEFIEVQQKGTWKRMTGSEVFGKKLLIMGLGKIGKEIAKRASVFGLEIYGYDTIFDDTFMKQYNIIPVKNIETIFAKIDIVSLNLPLLSSTKNIINKTLLQIAKKEIIIVNTARGELVNQTDIIDSLISNKIKGYLTDVLDEEPMPESHPLRNLKNVLITPHIGSRTLESVQRQGLMAVNNLIEGLNNL